MNVDEMTDEERHDYYQTAGEDSLIYGGLVLSVNPSKMLEPITFPFSNLPQLQRGNQVRDHSNVMLQEMDYWHGGTDNSVHQASYVPERYLGVEGYCSGKYSVRTLRDAIYQFIVLSTSRTQHEESDSEQVSKPAILDAVHSSLYRSNLPPTAMSLAVSSSQSKFILLSKEVPLNLSVFSDDAVSFLTWTNEYDLDARMRDHYGSRFAVFRMRPLVDSVAVLHSFYLKKKLKRWRYEMQDKLRLMNALESLIQRRSKGNSD